MSISRLVLVVLCLVSAGCGSGGENPSPAVTDPIDSTPTEDTVDAEPKPPTIEPPDRAMARELAAAREAVEVAESAANEADAREFAVKEHLAAIEKAALARAEEEKGRYEAALELYRDGAELYGAAAESARSGAAAMAEIRKLRSSYRGLIKTAEQLSIDDSPRRKAKNAFDEGDRQLDADQIHVAKAAFERAVTTLRVEVAKAKATAADRERAHELLDSVDEMFETANATQVEQYASAPYYDAVAAKKLGEAAWRRHEYPRAIAHLESAEKHLRAAFREREARIERGDTIARGDDDEPDSGTDDVADAGDSETDTESSSGGSPDDELRMRLEQIFAGTVRIENDDVIIRYESGESLRADCRLVQGEKNAKFDRSELLEGNTRGFLEHKAVFDGKVSIEANVRFALVLAQSPQFQLLTMVEGGTFVGSNFGVDIGEWKGGKLRGVRGKSRVKSFRRPPAKWVSLKGPLTFALKAERKEDEILFQAVHEGREAATWDSKKHVSGHVGILWNNVRFALRTLEIRGRLDPTWLTTAE